MDPKLLLVKIITLLYKESQYKEANARSTALAKDLIATIKFPETGMDFDRTRENMQALRATALWLCEADTNEPFDRASLLQRIRINAGDDEAVYYAFEQGTENIEVGEELQKQVLALRSELYDILDNVKVVALLKKAYYASAFGDSPAVGSRDFIRDIYAQLEPFTQRNGTFKIKGSVDEVDLNDTDDLARVLELAKEEVSTDGVLKLPYQAINRMLGDHNGILRGECVVLGALQHNFKTGFTLGIFKGVAMYNTPWMLDPTKKPLLVHISVENSLQSNILWLYANLYENETGLECDLSKIDIAYAKQYIHERMTATGYHIKMVRWDPSMCTYHTVQDYIESLEAEGYEVHLCAIDYLNMFPKTGCVQGTAGEDIRDLWRRNRNFFSKRRTAFISPHQLSTDAKNLVRQGVAHFVKDIANKGYYDGTKRLDQEVDLELYIHIEKVEGRSYLTVQRGKHRKPKPTPDKYLYTVLPFHDIGAIRDDILGEDLSIAAVPGAEGSGGEWWKTS